MDHSPARTELIEEHLPLVQHIVLQAAVHFPRHVDRTELARAGTLGLVEAARRFEPSRGVPFDKFAARRIRGAILDSVRSADWAPRSVRVLARRLDRAEQELAGAAGHTPSPDELAAALGIETQELHRLRERVFRSVVLALEHVVVLTEDEDLTLLDQLADRTAVEPSEELEARELLGYLRDAVGLLPSRHRLVVVGYFLEGRTSAELAELLGVTESRVSQLRTEALAMLRDALETHYSGSTQPVVAGELPADGAARRRAEYVLAVGEASVWRQRLLAG